MSASAEDLKKILELTKLLNSSRDVKYILDEMMHKTMEIIKTADIAVIFLYDDKTNTLKSMASVGFGNQEFTLKPNESITGNTFVSKKTLFLETQNEVNSAMSTLKKETKTRLEDNCVYLVSDLQSSISCPLMHNNECIGVFVLDNFNKRPPLTKEDVYLAELISLNATIAIVNASNYRQMIQEKDRYAYSTFLHNKFTEMVLKGENIDDIINEVSNMRKKDILVIDTYFKVTNYTTNSLIDAHTIETVHNQFLNQICSNAHSKFHSKKQHLWILYNPIRVNETLLGWVAILSPTDDFPESELITIDKCSTIIALEILKNEELLSMEQSLKGDFLENLISNHSNELLIKFSKRYDYNFDHPHRLIIMNFNATEIDESYLKKLRYLYKNIRATNINTFDNSITLQKRNHIITIYDCKQEISRRVIDDLMVVYKEQTTFVTSMTNIDVTVRTIISDEISSLDSFKNIYEQTMRIFNLNISNSQSFQHYYYSDLKIKKMLLTNSYTDLENFVFKVLGPLKQHHNNSKFDLYCTLKIYIQSSSNWTDTKSTLHIHGNTLTYRLSRLKDILGYDINEYYPNLCLKIAFEIIDLYPEFGIKI